MVQLRLPVIHLTIDPAGQNGMFFLRQLVGILRGHGPLVEHLRRFLPGCQGFLVGERGPGKVVQPEIALLDF